jgi:hypothetical protein
MTDDDGTCEFAIPLGWSAATGIATLIGSITPVGWVVIGVTLAAVAIGAGVYYARSKGFTLSKAGDGISEHKNGNNWNKHTNPRAGRLKTKNRSAKKWKGNANPKRHGGKINQPKYKAYYSNHKRHHKTYYRTYHKKYKTYRYRRTYRYRTKH